jgi:phosphatidylserine decarboxylase
MLPLSRHGFWEMLIGTLLVALIWAALAWFGHWRWGLILLPLWIWLIAFFRDPQRTVPAGPNLMVSPADGTVSDITELPDHALLGGPAVRVGIFLSVFSVHVNRAPCDGVVTDIRFQPGKFINAMNHSQASEQNQSNTLVISDPAGGKPVAVVRQIVGLIARRIVCEPGVGSAVTRGQRIGMIKFGSRTELIIPKSLNPQVRVAVGQKVRGAADLIAEISP